MPFVTELWPLSPRRPFFDPHPLSSLLLHDVIPASSSRDPAPTNSRCGDPAPPLATQPDQAFPTSASSLTAHFFQAHSLAFRRLSRGFLLPSDSRSPVCLIVQGVSNGSEHQVIDRTPNSTSNDPVARHPGLDCRGHNGRRCRGDVPRTLSESRNAQALESGAFRRTSSFPISSQPLAHLTQITIVTPHYAPSPYTPEPPFPSPLTAAPSSPT